MTTKLLVKNPALGIDFGMVQMVSSIAQANAPFMIFLHGIGERGAGTQASLTTLLNGIPQQIKDGIEKYGWICLAVQSDSSFSLNEPGFARAWGLTNLPVNPNKKYLFGLSWGAGGAMGFVLSSLANAKLFDCVCVDSMTWVNGSAKNVVDANLPIWCGHNINDNNSGTPPAATESWIDAINAFKPKVQAIKTMFNGPVVHGSWGSFFATGSIPIPAGSRGMIDPACNAWQFAMLNDATTRVQVPSLSSNPIPVPTLVPDFTATLSGNTLTLDGTASKGVKTGWDGFLWDIQPLWGSGQGSYGYALSGKSPYGGPIKTASNLQPGGYTIELTVQDTGGKLLKKKIELWANAPAVKVPTGYDGKYLTFRDGTQDLATVTWTGSIFQAKTEAGVIYTLQ